LAILDMQFYVTASWLPVMYLEAII